MIFRVQAALCFFALFSLPLLGDDDAVRASKLFSLSSPGLRSFEQSAEPALPVEAEPAAAKTSAAGEFSLSEQGVDSSMESLSQRYKAMNGSPPLFLPPAVPERGGAIGWVEREVFDPIFIPEVVKIRNVRVSSSIITAIKRKNPFCLLNPLVFTASW